MANQFSTGANCGVYQGKYINLILFSQNLLFMLVIADGFHCSASCKSWFYSSSWATSITRTDLVWIRNLVVPKGTGSVPFLQALENWNGSISNWRSSNLDRIDPDRSDKNVEMESKKVQKDENAEAKLNNQHTRSVLWKEQLSKLQVYMRNQKTCFSSTKALDCQ